MPDWLSACIVLKASRKDHLLSPKALASLFNRFWEGKWKYCKHFEPNEEYKHKVCSFFVSSVADVRGKEKALLVDEILHCSKKELKMEDEECANCGHYIAIWGSEYEDSIMVMHGDPQHCFGLMRYGNNPIRGLSNRSCCFCGCLKPKLKSTSKLSKKVHSNHCSCEDCNPKGK